MSFSLNVVTIGDFVSFSESRFSLAPGQEKSIIANIIGRKLGSYFGSIEVVGDRRKYRGRNAQQDKK